MAFITVTDAAGRVLFRRPATLEEIEEAKRAAAEAEFDASEALDELAQRRALATADSLPTASTVDAFDAVTEEVPEPSEAPATVAALEDAAPRRPSFVDETPFVDSADGQPLFDEAELAQLLGEPGSRPVERLRMPGSTP